MTDNLKQQIGIIEVSHLVRWIRSVTTGHYTVRFEYGADTAYVDYIRKEIVIPQPNEKMTIRDAIRLRGFCIHETSHPRYQPNLAVVMSKHPVKANSPLAGIFNLFLDVHAESMRAEEFPGDAKALSEFGAIVGHDCYERMSAALKANGNVWPKGFEKIASVLIACKNAEGTWNIGMVLGFQKLIDLYPEEAKRLSVELESKFDLTRRLVTEGYAENEESLWELSKQVYEFLYKKDPESQIEPPEGGKGKPKKGKKGEGEESESDAGGLNGNGDGEDTDAQADEKIKISELLFTDHYDAKSKGRGHGQGFDYSQFSESSKYTPVDPATFDIINYGKK